MTTLLDRISTVLGPATPEAIQAKIDAIRTTLPTLEAAVGDCAYQVELGDDGAASNLGVARTALNEAKERLDNLGLSLARAIAARDAATEASREKLRQSQRIALRNRLTARDEAGARLAAAMGETIAAYRDMVAENDEVVNILSAMGAARLHGTLTTFTELQTAVLNELWRQGGAIPPAPSFPGAKFLSIDHQFAPDRAPDLVKTLRASSEWLQRNVINPPKE